MFRAILMSVLVGFGGCKLLPRIEPPEALQEGAFLVHVVSKEDESLPAILTWYTGSALSQPIVEQHNPFLASREARVGDRIRIPIEIVANQQRYVTDASQEVPRKAAPNLLMEREKSRGMVSKGDGEGQKKSEIPLETFNDDTNPDKIEDGSRVTISKSERASQLEEEIRVRQRELNELKRTRPIEQFDDEDMPPEISNDLDEGS